ncbi:MAG: hypothetical protein GY714_29805 [Desulfobacterales bacterium]|nr:hypothetical protein [Desulfobacterales bacterium]MCP4158720.1 hypothetical protein [Deltaproteobacteria bacterium]
MEFLNRLVKSDDFLILVIGEEGAGKTTLLNHFLSKASEKWRSCKISATPASEKTEFENLNGHPAFILQNEELPVIMLDNAHKLSTDELQFLIELAGKSGHSSKLKRVVLFCEPKIQVKLSDLSSKVSDENTINKIYIPQLTNGDTKEYLEQRLNVAGYKGQFPFSANDLGKISKQGGIPGKINEEAAIILEKKADRNIFNKLRNIGLVAASFIAAVLISAVFLKDNNNVIKDKSENIKIESPEFEDIIEEEDPVEKINETRKQETLEEKDPVEEISEAQKQEILEKIGEVDVTISEEKKKDTTEPKVSQTPPKEKKVAKKKTVNLRELKRERWLLAQKPSYFTLQILGVRKKESLLRFVRKHKLKNYAYFHTSFKNKDWYPLLYGVYPTFKAATSAIKKLPKEFREYSPWVRQMSSVHRAIRNKRTALNIKKIIAIKSDRQKANES